MNQKPENGLVPWATISECLNVKVYRLEIGNAFITSKKKNDHSQKGCNLGCLTICICRLLLNILDAGNRLPSRKFRLTVSPNTAILLS